MQLIRCCLVCRSPLIEDMHADVMSCARCDAKNVTIWCVLIPNHKPLCCTAHLGMVGRIGAAFLKNVKFLRRTWLAYSRWHVERDNTQVLSLIDPDEQVTPIAIINSPREARSIVEQLKRSGLPLHRGSESRWRVKLTPLEEAKQ